MQSPSHDREGARTLSLRTPEVRDETGGAKSPSQRSSGGDIYEVPLAKF